MKIALNNRNVILKQYIIKAFDCSRCCFYHNLALCEDLTLRDCGMCKIVKTLDCHKLYDIFKL